MSSSLSSISSSDSDPEENLRPRLPRVIRDRTDPFNSLSELEFKSRFRLTKGTVMHLLHQIGENIEPNTNRNKSLSAMQQILMTLRFYATGTFHQVVGDTLGGVHKSTVSRTI